MPCTEMSVRCLHYPGFKQSRGFNMLDLQASGGGQFLKPGIRPYKKMVFPRGIKTRLENTSEGLVGRLEHYRPYLINPILYGYELESEDNEQADRFLRPASRLY
jgi:hypothetical protein